ncbi:MAG TPA: hypothetical protein PLB46_12855 [Chitinophagales bacterium]|nr:hypothetical protein [Chitinophagales bacterium]
MNKPDIIKFIKKYINPYFTEYMQDSIYLLRVSKDQLFIYGYIFDRNSAPENIINCRAFIVPMFYPTDFIYLDYCSEIKYIGKGNNIDLKTPIDPEVVNWLIGQLNDRRIFFESYVGANKFLKYFEDFHSTLYKDPVSIFAAILSNKQLFEHDFEVFYAEARPRMNDVAFIAERFRIISEIHQLYKVAPETAKNHLLATAEISFKKLKLNKVLTHSLEHPNGI